MKLLRTEEEIISTWNATDSRPVVSICCTTYNHEKYIEDALEGFLTQETDFPIEILIHDDASSDKTVDIIRSYVKKYPNLIKPIYQDVNQYSNGKKVNIEFNLSRSKAKYIAICEGDDYWTDSMKLKAQVEFLNKHDDYVITFHDTVSLINGERVKNKFNASRRDVSSYELKKALPIYTLTSCFRNVIKVFPPEISAAKLGDKYIWSLLGAFGKGKYMPGIKPSVYRIHDCGIFSLKSDLIRYKMAFYTDVALSSYYERVGDKELSYYFFKKSLRTAFELCNLKLLIMYLAKTILSRIRSFFLKTNLNVIKN